MPSTDYYEIVDLLLKKLSPRYVKKFELLNSNKNRFSFLQSNDDIRDLLSEQIRNIDISKSLKSNSTANKHRNQGNTFFKAGNFNKALEEYNKCILHASHETDKRLPDNLLNTIELALGLSNRSVVMLKLGRFKECIDDVQDSLQCGYPSTQRYKLLERLATCYMQEGDLSKANKHFQLMKQHLNSSDLTDVQKNVQMKLIDEKISLCSDEGNDSKSKQISDSKDQYKRHNAIDDLINKLQSDNPLPELSRDAIRFEYSSNVGKHAIASRDIKTGEVVLVDQTFAKVLTPSEKGNCCYYCFTSLSLDSDSIHPCQICTEVVYCSKKCRNFSKVLDKHDMECPLYSKWIRSKTGPLAWLVVRILMSIGMEKWIDIVRPLNLIDSTIIDNQSKDRSDYNHDPMIDDELIKEKYERKILETAPKIYNLVSHSDKRDPTELFQFSILALWIVLLLKENNYFDQIPQENTADTDQYIGINTSSDDNVATIGGIALKFLQIIACNGIEITTINLEPTLSKCHPRSLGVALYPNASLFNHSCDPDLELLFVKDVCVARSIKPIRRGSPVNIDYGFIFYSTSKQERIDHLKNQYFFQCSCTACVNNWPVKKYLALNIDQSNHNREGEFQCPVCHLKSMISIDLNNDKIENKNLVVVKNKRKKKSNTSITNNSSFNIDTSTECINNPSNQQHECDQSLLSSNLYRCKCCDTITDQSTINDLNSKNRLHKLEDVLKDAQEMKISSNAVKFLESFLNCRYFTTPIHVTQEMVNCISTLKQCYRLFVNDHRLDN